MSAGEREQLLNELDQTISLLEAKLPANIERPANQKLAKDMQKEVADYFKALEQAVDYAAIARLYNEKVKNG